MCFLKRPGRETDHYAYIVLNLSMQGSVPSLLYTPARLGAQLNTGEFTFTFTNPYSTNKRTFLVVCISRLINCYMFRLNCHQQAADTLLLELTAVQ